MPYWSKTSRVQSPIYTKVMFHRIFQVQRVQCFRWVRSFFIHPVKMCLNIVSLTTGDMPQCLIIYNWRNVLSSYCLILEICLFLLLTSTTTDSQRRKIMYVWRHRNRRTLFKTMQPIHSHQAQTRNSNFHISWTVTQHTTT